MAQKRSQFRGYEDLQRGFVKSARGMGHSRPYARYLFRCWLKSEKRKAYLDLLRGRAS